MGFGPTKTFVKITWPFSINTGGIGAIPFEFGGMPFEDKPNL